MSRTVIDDIVEAKRVVRGKMLWANHWMAKMGEELYELPPEDIKKLWYYLLILPRHEYFEKYNSSEEKENSLKVDSKEDE